MEEVLEIQYSMTPRDLSHRRIQEVQKVIAQYVPQHADIEPNLLVGLCRAVLSSIDVRDLRDVKTLEFIGQAEELLTVSHKRADGDINVGVTVDGENAVVVACLDDQPFLVSSLRALFKSEGIELRASLNAIIRSARSQENVLVGFDGAKIESLMRFEIRGAGLTTDGLEEKVRHRLKIARAMVRDFNAMRGHINAVADRVAVSAKGTSAPRSAEMLETEGLLRWLCDENFVIFSVEEYDGEGRQCASFGIAGVSGQPRELGTALQLPKPGARPVRYYRSIEESPVHRSGKPGFFVFAVPGADGNLGSLCVVEGLFTYKALHTPPETIPFLRVTLTDMLRSRDVSAESHRGKSITNAFNSLPLEFLVSETRDNIWELTDRVLRAEAEGGSDVHIKVSDDRRFAFVFVALPRWQFSEELRLAVQRVLQRRFDANYSDYGVYIDRDENAILHFYISGVRSLPEVDVDSLREEVLSHAKGWNERLREALGEVVPAHEVSALFEDYVDAFAEEHMRRAGGERLAGDILCLQRLREGLPIDCDLFVSRTSEHPGSLNLRVFTREPLSLSRQLPVLAGFGFEVIDEYTREVRLPHLPPIGMHTFRLNVRRSQHGHLLGRSEALRNAIVQVFSGLLGDDSLNRLIVTAEMSADEVQMIRAYVAYMHQLRAPFSDTILREVLSSHPAVAQSFVHLLSARFGHDGGEWRSEDAVLATLKEELAAVSDYTADRALRAISEVVQATVRTNAFTATRLDGEALAFKFDGTAVPFGPEPRPFREIWVYHPDFQGVHLRGGKVARGGLRFSDRPDDFRTEIHDLVATQMVKNVLIVPMGAKGGFVLNHPPSERSELRRAGDATYPKFIRALLSITDNVVEGEVITPEGIRHQEDPDPYLVVAADKGTAHLSDVANRESQTRGFWLDDAFASGGSNGYDHKATGITARGAWEVAKRNFRELGIDPESDVITAIGVGDMSGDVFGNGLLRSRTVKLLAAFNHMHVFIDPNPDCERSYEERLRLFNQPGSQWSDYSQDLLSEGGGVFLRHAKEVKLSPQARTLLGLAPDVTLSGEALIREVMRLRVDLFWMGGIGTYVKSSEESDADVGDKANDNVRINANQLNCKVFAEGANLSITERGRVEFARRGGLNYTASLDNSGGVDTSDHEVNLKILYSPLLNSGKVTREQRNETLKVVEGEICEMVLDNNRSQSRMASFDVRRSRHDTWRYCRAQQLFVDTLRFNPRAFAMPSAEEYSRRALNHEGLFKCETAVLGLHAKMFAYGQLLDDRALPDELVRDMVRDYFPARVRDVVGNEALDQHLLRREIATTMIVNLIVDNLGATFFTELSSVTGMRVRDVVTAYDIVHRIVGLTELYDELYELEDKHRQIGVYEGMCHIADGLEDAVFYILGPTAMEIGDRCIEEGRRLLERIDGLLPVELSERFEARVQKLVERSIPEETARRICRLDYLTVVLDTLSLSQGCGQPLNELLSLRLRVANAMRLTRLISATTSQTYVSPWDGPAAQALCRQLEVHIHKMVRLVEDGDIQGMLNRYGLDGVQHQIEGHLQGGEVSIAGLVMIDLQMRRLLPQHALVARNGGKS